jgi:glycosyltransferase involved in cell wall biosynthesis
MIKFSIVVPCYNESENIPLILDRFKKVILREDIEVILVNNGSTDNSESVINKLVPNYTFAKAIKIDVNKGYGFGIVTGLKQAKGEYIGYTHADMQTDPFDIVMGLEILESQEKKGSFYVKGKRKGRPITDEIFTAGMSVFESIYLGTVLWDINAQPNIFPKTFFDSICAQCPDDFSLDLFFLYKAKKLNLNIIRFPVRFPQRIFGYSSWNNGLASKWKFIKRTLEFSTKLKHKL